MKLLSFLFASVAAAELTFSATAVQDGKEVDTSGLEFVPIPPRSRSHFRHNVSNYTADASTYAVREKRHNEKRLSVSLSSNWCGVSQHAESNDPLTSVSGFFSAPNLHDRTGTYPQYGAAWIGMDGASCQQTLLQAGVTTIVRTQPLFFPVKESSNTSSAQLQRPAVRLRLVGMGPKGVLRHHRLQGGGR